MCQIMKTISLFLTNHLSISGIMFVTSNKLVSIQGYNIKDMVPKHVSSNI